METWREWREAARDFIHDGGDLLHRPHRRAALLGAHDRLRARDAEGVEVRIPYAWTTDPGFIRVESPVEVGARVAGMGFGRTDGFITARVPIPKPPVEVEGEVSSG